jgi:hypothetical protein
MLSKPVEFEPVGKMKEGGSSLHMLASVEELAYKALPPPHIASLYLSRVGCFSSCSGFFPGFVGLRFICLSCVVSSEGHECGSEFRIRVHCCV